MGISAKETKICGDQAHKKEDVLDFSNSVVTAQHLIEREDHRAAIQSVGVIFEDGLREFLSRLEKSLTSQDEKEKFQKLERKIGEDRTFLKFHLSQLTRFISEDKIWKIAQRLVTSNLRLSKNIQWKLVAQWRNDAAHDETRIELPEIQSVQMLIWAKIFLYEFELLSEKSLVAVALQFPKIQKDCPRCGLRLKSKWAFCPECGSSRETRCRNCGRALPSDFKICPYCEMRTSISTYAPGNEAEAQYSLLCRGAWMDGVLNRRERKILETYRLKEGIEQSVADRIERQSAPIESLSYYNFVEAAHVDKIITPEERRFLDLKAKELGLSEDIQQEIEDVFIQTDTEVNNPLNCLAEENSLFREKAPVMNS